MRACGKNSLLLFPEILDVDQRILLEQSIFSKFQDVKDDILSPLVLRQALSLSFANQNRFQLGNCVCQLKSKQKDTVLTIQLILPHFLGRCHRNFCTFV